MTKIENQLLKTWLESEKQKDLNELNREKNDIIKEITKIDKSEFFRKEYVKEEMTLWNRIKRTLLG